MAKEEFNIKHFTTKVRQMILQYKAVKEENDGLYAMIDERDKQIAELKNKVDKMKNDYENLKLAKMLAVSDGDVEVTRKRVNHLIREVEQCITLFNNKK